MTESDDYDLSSAVWRGLWLVLGSSLRGSSGSQRFQQYKPALPPSKSTSSLLDISAAYEQMRRRRLEIDMIQTLHAGVSQLSLLRCILPSFILARVFPWPPSTLSGPPQLEHSLPKQVFVLLALQVSSIEASPQRRKAIASVFDSSKLDFQFAPLG